MGECAEMMLTATSLEGERSIFLQAYLFGNVVIFIDQ